MSRKASPTFIGAFVLGATALSVIGILVFGTGKFFSDRTRYILYFEGRVKGLQVGAPVAFRGVQIGNVTDIRMYFHPEKMTIRIPVIIEVDLRKFTQISEKLVNSEATVRIMDQLVENGLRAQLKLQSLLTGQLYVDFDFHPDREANYLMTEFAQMDAAYSELPTIPSEMEEIAKVLGKLPIEALAYKALDALEGIENMINSTEMKEGFAALTQTMRHIEELALNINQEIVPLATDARELIRTLDGFADKSNTLIQKVDNDVILTLAGARKLVEHMEITLENVNDQIIPVADEIKMAAEAAQNALDQATKAFMALETFSRKETPMGHQFYNAFDELASAARSIRLLAEYLERHPEALVRGKRGMK